MKPLERPAENILPKNDRLRILIVQETNWVDRNVIQQHHLAERLVKRGHYVEVIDYDILWPTRTAPPRWQPRQEFPAVNKVIDGVSLQVTRPATIQLPLLAHMSWTTTSLLELRSKLESQPFDLVIGLTLTNSYFMARLLQWRNIPFISIVQEPYHTMVPQRWLWSAARMMEGAALRASNRVVVFTPQMREYVICTGVDTGQVTVLKTGVSLDLFHENVDGSERRRELGIGPDEWVIFFMGWLYDFSGLLQIVQQIADDSSVLHGARFLIVGDGDIYDELHSLVSRYGIERHVIMTGRRPYEKIPSLVAAADVCMLPSLTNDTTREIVPMKVYEYLAACKPVVASNLPGLKAEFGEDSGIVYADGPIDALHRAVALADLPHEARELAAAGRRAAEKNADWEKTTVALEALLMASVQENGKTSYA
ncbi:MAG: glycosyltransferase family 4 protein [Chloroflexota bacterium]|nr:glycosyltransferase family 4 protein [Chloroflexota bacterium]